MTGTDSAETAVYFAYGTLLDKNHMKEFCPTAEPIGVMRLKGYRLGFSRCSADTSVGGCNLKAAPGHTMYGVLYKVSAQDLSDLNQASGVHKGLWATKAITLIDELNRKVEANTYIIEKDAGDYNPPAAYTKPILEGVRKWNIPKNYVEELESIIKAEGAPA